MTSKKAFQQQSTTNTHYQQHKNPPFRFQQGS